MGLWQRRKKEIVERIVYVPVLTGDVRLYNEKWNDPEYLKQVKAIRGNIVYNTESFEALRTMRLIADYAKTPEELSGVQKCIKVMRDLATVAERAEKRLESNGGYNDE